MASDHSYHTFFSFAVLDARWPVAIKSTLLPTGVKFTKAPATTMSTQGGVSGDFSYGRDVAPILDILVTDSAGQTEKVHWELKANPVPPLAVTPHVGLVPKQTSGNSKGCQFTINASVANTPNEGRDLYDITWNPANLGTGWSVVVAVPAQGIIVSATVTPKTKEALAGTPQGTATTALKCN